MCYHLKLRWSLCSRHSLSNQRTSSLSSSIKCSTVKRQLFVINIPHFFPAFLPPSWRWLLVNGPVLMLLKAPRANFFHYFMGTHFLPNATPARNVRAWYDGINFCQYFTSPPVARSFCLPAYSSTAPLSCVKFMNTHLNNFRTENELGGKKTGNLFGVWFFERGKNNSSSSDLARQGLS